MPDIDDPPADAQPIASRAPKCFISYAWTDHTNWVLQLAADLRANGVDVRIDRWHLREGHDATAFMESMVTDKDVGKVIIICDKTYAERADARSGGVALGAISLPPICTNSSVILFSFNQSD